jgi:predicted transcriptional regulator YdeE
VARFTKGENIIKAWTEFYYNEVPKTRYIVNEEQNLYFEYYPTNVNGEYELWIPVVKADV